MKLTNLTHRITSIDLLRGIVILFMALDHVRDYFNYDAYFFDPTDLTQTYPALFWTRFITHFCAPVFVFLAGSSAFFIGQKRTKKSLSGWLLKRGFWLIFLELTVIKLAWYFKLDYSTILLQVIWVLGLSMVFLAGFIYMPKKILIGISLLAIFSHNLFDSFAPTTALLSNIWIFLHQFNIVTVGNTQIYVAYPAIPWIFVMPLGYYFAELYKPSVSSQLRTKRLMQIGSGLILTFFIIRTFNFYGEPYLWSSQNSLGFTIMSFFNISKYPPSLLFLLLTLGLSILFLAFAENWKGKIIDKLIVFGRTPMFFYILHIYVIHAAAVIAAQFTGFRFTDMQIDVWVTMQSNLQGYGFGLKTVYLIWLLLIIALYPVCNKYNNYKSTHKNIWWLSYL